MRKHDINAIFILEPITIPSGVGKTLLIRDMDYDVNTAIMYMYCQK